MRKAEKLPEMTTREYERIKKRLIGDDLEDEINLTQLFESNE